MSLSAAKYRVTQARMYLQERRTDEIEPVLVAAEGFLDGLDDPGEIEQVPAVRQQIAAIRAQVAAAPPMPGQRPPSEPQAPPEEPAAAQVPPEELAEPRVPAEELAEPQVPAEELAEPQVPAEEAAAAEVGSDASGDRPTFDPAGFEWLEAGSTGGTGSAGVDEQQVFPEEMVTAPLGELSDEDAANLSRARSRVTQARMLLESGRTENIAYTLDEAAGFLAGIAPMHKNALLAEVEAIRAELGDELGSDDVRWIEEELSRHLTTAESNIGVHPHHTDEALARLAQRLTEDDVTRALSPESIERFRARAAEIAARQAGNTRSEALDRAVPLLEELERRLEVDPLAGLDQPEAYRVTADLRALKDRVLGAVRALPEDDPDVAAIGARLLATDHKLDEACVARGRAELDAQVSRGWDAISADIDGWEQEEPDPDTGRLTEPRLPKTRLAVHRIRYLLTDAETIRIRADNPDDAGLAATYREAEQAFEGACAKMHWAYTRVLDAAEAMPTPMNRFELDRAAMLATAAEQTFAGTRYVDVVVGRARDLEERWQAEVAAVTKGRQELYDKLAVEADAVWPSIAGALSPDPGFDPGDPDLRGRTVLLEGVYNRSGWDFDGGDFDFAMRHRGVPLGGDYEPHVRAALEHAWYELKLDVNDRIAWDLVAVVEGPGTIGRRTSVVLRDKDSNLEIGKIEEWSPEDCVRLRIVALHAGPVAVGPPS